MWSFTNLSGLIYDLPTVLQFNGNARDKKIIINNGSKEVLEYQIHDCIRQCEK